MNVALLHTKTTVRADFLLAAMSSGIVACGDTVMWVRDMAALRAAASRIDVAVQVCFPNKAKTRAASQLDVNTFRLDANVLLANRGVRIVTLDTGFVRNQTVHEMAVLKKSPRTVFFGPQAASDIEPVAGDIYYSLGYDGLKRRADYCNQQSPGDRWAKLNCQLQPWRQTGTHILVLGQTWHGMSSQHIDIYDWYADVVREIRRHSDRPVVFRHHPRISKLRPGHDGRQWRNRIKKDRENIRRVLAEASAGFDWHTGHFLEDDLRDCWAVVSFTTNAAVEAAVYGVPVFAMDEGNMAYEVAEHDLAAIESPSMQDRQQWAWNIAYAQWNALEMRSGEAWAHLRPHALKPRSGNWGVLHL